MNTKDIHDAELEERPLEVTSDAALDAEEQQTPMETEEEATRTTRFCICGKYCQQ